MSTPEEDSPPTKPLAPLANSEASEGLVSEPAVETGRAPSGLQPISEETQLLYELVGDAHLLTVIVLVGASALLPVPFLDDYAKSYLERRMLKAIAKREGMTLTSEELERLTVTPETDRGCCLGCLGKAVVYPIKKIVFYPIKKLLRKVFFFLEIKRSMDQSSTALAEAWLFALALRRGFWSPGRDIAQADQLRDVVDSACNSQGVKPLETAFGHAFQGAKDTLLDFAGRFTGKNVGDREKMDQAMSRLEEEESEKLDSLSRKLREALSEVGEVYLQRFAEEFEKQLEEARTRPSSPVA